MELVTQRKFAEITGTTPTNIHKLIRGGKIPIENGKVVLDEALIAYELIKKNPETNCMTKEVKNAAEVALALNQAKLDKER